MSQDNSNSSNNNDSKFAGYTKEKLYELLPAIYRQRDAAAGRPLEDLIGIIAEQVALMEKDIGGLYDNWFIETCDEWVTAYVADLVGARSLSASRAAAASSPLSTGETEEVSQRAYVANTIAYRRRKGTAAMLEQLARDTTQWGARAVEFFQLLAATQHLNHVRTSNHRTPDLRNTSALENLYTPLDTATHTVEVRRIASNRGRYNIQNVGLFLWRLQAFPSSGTHAFAHLDPKAPDKKTTDRFSFSPLGYDAPLFNLPEDEDAITHIAEEANLPVPIRRRTLYDNPGKYYDRERSIFLQVKYAGQTERRDIALSDIVVCSLSKWHHPNAEGKVAIDPELGRIMLPQEAEDVVALHHYGFAGKLGGGQYSRRQQGSRGSATTATTKFRIKKRDVFVWNSVPSSALESRRLRDMLRNDFGIAWIEEGMGFTKSENERAITLTDGTDNGHHLTISLNEGNAGASLEVDGVDTYEFFAWENPDTHTIYVSKHEGVYGSFRQAKERWDESTQKHIVFEIADSEVYDKAMVLNLPAGCTAAIVAAAGQRPVLRTLRVQGESGSRLLLEGLWFNNSTSGTPVIKVGPGDMESIEIKHCTLVPGRDTARQRRVSVAAKSYVRRYLCTWEKAAGNVKSHSEPLIRFLRRNFASWIPATGAAFEEGGGGSLKLVSGKKSLSLSLVSSSAAAAAGSTVARLGLKDDESGEAEENVYEFTIITENGNRNLYLKGGNDNLEVSLDRSITGRICIADSLILTWGRVPNEPDDSRYLCNFLKENFYLPWLKPALLKRAGNVISAASADGKRSLSITLEQNDKEKSGRAILKIKGAGEGDKEKKVYEFVARSGGRVYMQSDASLAATDSIIDGKGRNEAVVASSASLQNVTVFGKTCVDRLALASNVIFTDTVRSKITQQGCVRFSYVPPGSVTPQRYMCQPEEEEGGHGAGGGKGKGEASYDASTVRPAFTSETYGDPGYAQLGRAVSAKISAGGDNGSEMGAFNHLFQPQRIADLRQSLDEYLRFGLEAGVFLVT